MNNEINQQPLTPLRYRTMVRNTGSSAAVSAPDIVTSALERFQDQTAWIAFGGHFKAGKSTLQNSLLGLDLLPSNDKPETGVACFVCRGDLNQAVVIDCHGKRTEIDCSAATIAGVSSLIDPVTGEHRPESTRATAVRATLANSPIPHGVCWIDTPGINDTGEMDNRARGALDDADLVVWVLNSQQLLSEVEQRFIADYVAEHGTRSIVFVVNVFLREDSEREWTEYITESQPAILDKIQRFFRGLQPEGISDRPLVFTTAARAVRSQPDRFDVDSLIPFVRGSALFWERVWLARSERLTTAINRQQAEEKEKAAARHSAASLVRTTDSQRSNPFMAAALKAFDREQFPEMLLNVAAAADHAPYESDPHVLRSIGLIFSKQYQFAIYAAERALRIAPEKAEALLPLGWARLELSDLPQARQDLDKFLNSSAAVGWQRTAALWLRARCVHKDDFGAACDDLLEACEDILGLTRLGLNAPALLFAVAHFFENGQRWDMAVSSYRKAMISAAPFENSEVTEAFETMCQTFAIPAISGHVLFAISRKAWDACKQIASGRDAAEIFIDTVLWALDGETKTVNLDLFLNDTNFFFYMASAYAKRNNPGDALAFLKLLLAAKPDFDIKIAKKDQYIGSCNSAELTQFLNPTFTRDSKAGTIVNYLTIKNTSAFRITNVTIYLHVTRADGAVDTVINLSANNLDSQGEQTWYEVFKNPGIFGKNIAKIETRMSCGELN